MTQPTDPRRAASPVAEVVQRDGIVVTKMLIMGDLDRSVRFTPARTAAQGSPVFRRR